MTILKFTSVHVCLVALVILEGCNSNSWTKTGEVHSSAPALTLEGEFARLYSESASPYFEVTSQNEDDHILSKISTTTLNATSADKSSAPPPEIYIRASAALAFVGCDEKQKEEGKLFFRSQGVKSTIDQDLQFLDLRRASELSVKKYDLLMICGDQKITAGHFQIHAEQLLLFKSRITVTTATKFLSVNTNVTFFMGYNELRMMSGIRKTGEVIAADLLLSSPTVKNVTSDRSGNAYLRVLYSKELTDSKKLVPSLSLRTGQGSGAPTSSATPLDQEIKLFN